MVVAVGVVVAVAVAAMHDCSFVGSNGSSDGGGGGFINLVFQLGLKLLVVVDFTVHCDRPSALDSVLLLF